MHALQDAISYPMIQQVIKIVKYFVMKSFAETETFAIDESAAVRALAFQQISAGNEFFYRRWCNLCANAQRHF